MSSEVQLEDNDTEAQIRVGIPKVQPSRKRATVKKDDTSTQLKRPKKKSDLPLFDPERSLFIGRSSDNSLTTRQSLFKDYVDGNDLDEFPSKMSRKQLGPQVEFLHNNSSAIQNNDFKEMRKVIRSVWGGKVQRNLQIAQHPKFNSVITSLHKSVDYDAEAAVAANELSINRDRDICYTELEDKANVAEECFLQSKRTEDDRPKIELCDANKISSIPLSLFDFYLDDFSLVRRLAGFVTSKQIEKLVKMALQSLTNNTFEQDNVVRFVESVWREGQITEEKFADNPELYVFTASLFKSVFFEGAETFKHYPKVFTSFHSIISAKLGNYAEVNAVLMTSYEDLVVQYDGSLSSNPLLFDSNGDDIDQEEHSIRNTLAPVLQFNQETLASIVVIADNELSENALTAPFQQPPEVSLGAARAQNERQVTPPFRISPILPNPSTNMPAQSSECEQANFLSSKKFVSLEEILKDPKSSKARLVSTMARSPDATDAIVKALYHAKFNPREFARAMKLLVTMLEGGSLGNLEDMRFKSVLEAFKKATFHCSANFFLLFMRIFKEELFKAIQISKTNIAPKHQHQQ